VSVLVAHGLYLDSKYWIRAFYLHSAQLVRFQKESRHLNSDFTRYTRCHILGQYDLSDVCPIQTKSARRLLLYKHIKVRRSLPNSKEGERERDFHYLGMYVLRTKDMRTALTLTGRSLAPLFASTPSSSPASGVSPLHDQSPPGRSFKLALCIVGCEQVQEVYSRIPHSHTNMPMYTHDAMDDSLGRICR
jgi:hypothetical protein